MISDLKFAAYYLPVFCFVNFSLEFFHRHIFIAGRLIPYRMEVGTISSTISTM